MKVDLHSVLIQPLLTEKVTALRESSNTVGFLVHPDANRLQIKRRGELRDSHAGSVDAALSARHKPVTNRPGRAAGLRPQ